MTTPKGEAISLILACFEAHVQEQVEYGNDGILNEPPADREQAKHILRHAIIHLVDPMWERRWPSAVRGFEAIQYVWAPDGDLAFEAAGDIANCFDTEKEARDADPGLSNYKLWKLECVEVIQTMDDLGKLHPISIWSTKDMAEAVIPKGQD